MIHSLYGGFQLRGKTKHNSNLSIFSTRCHQLGPTSFGEFSLGAIKSINQSNDIAADVLENCICLPFNLDDFFTEHMFRFWEPKSKWKPSWVGRSGEVFFSILLSSTNFKMRYWSEDLVQNIYSFTRIDWVISSSNVLLKIKDKLEAKLIWSDKSSFFFLMSHSSTFFLVIDGRFC